MIKILLTERLAVDVDAGTVVRSDEKNETKLLYLLSSSM